MDFREEYKYAAQELSPDRAAIDRMKAKVIRDIRSPKKRMPIRQIAYIGGAVAACAVVTVTAIVALPRLGSKDMLAATDSPAESANGLVAFDKDFAEDSAVAEVENSVRSEECAVEDEVAKPSQPESVYDGAGEFEGNNSMTDGKGESPAPGIDIVAGDEPGAAESEPVVDNEVTDAEEPEENPRGEEASWESGEAENETGETEETNDAEEPVSPDEEPVSDAEQPLTAADYFPNCFSFADGQGAIKLQFTDKITTMVKQEGAVPDAERMGEISILVREKASGVKYRIYFPEEKGMLWVFDEGDNFVGLYILKEEG